MTCSTSIMRVIGEKLPMPALIRRETYHWATLEINRVRTGRQTTQTLRNSMIDVLRSGTSSIYDIHRRLNQPSHEVFNGEHITVWNWARNIMKTGIYLVPNDQYEEWGSTIDIATVCGATLSLRVYPEGSDFRDLEF